MATTKTIFAQDFVSYKANPKKDSIKFFYKDADGKRYETFDNIQKHISGKLVFAMNGGMFLDDHSPCGLYIENGKVIRKINEYSKSGVFYITKSGKAFVCDEADVPEISTIRYATQSLPVLLKDGEINPRLKQESPSIYTRSGVGILPNGDILFAISKTEINLWRFAKYFEEKGCINALYLDGGISEMYYPERQMTTSYGNFGVIIGIVK